VYLRSLKLRGFKSFPQPVEVLLEPGVAVIVGPNGSGKSNIADALRWVLGEQSYTLLRGKKTEDMIFNGSEHRPRAKLLPHWHAAAHGGQRIFVIRLTPSFDGHRLAHFFFKRHRRDRAIVLDVGLPDISGLEVARRIRATGSDVAILILTARDTVGDRVTGLDAGADDYLVKPFAYEELSARLRALGRRGHGSRRPEPKLIVGPITLDETSRRVTLDGKRIDLSPREFSLLECFLRHPGQTLSRDQLLDQAWPFSVAVTPNAVDAYVHYLRDKLGAAGKLIETVRGVGYRLADA
jgi:DNA-binding response OmpR family regulator